MVEGGNVEGEQMGRRERQGARLRSLDLHCPGHQLQAPEMWLV